MRGSTPFGEERPSGESGNEDEDGNGSGSADGSGNADGNHRRRNGLGHAALRAKAAYGDDDQPRSGPPEPD